MVVLVALVTSHKNRVSRIIDVSRATKMLTLFFVETECFSPLMDVNDGRTFPV